MKKEEITQKLREYEMNMLAKLKRGVSKIETKKTKKKNAI